MEEVSSTNGRRKSLFIICVYDLNKYPLHPEIRYCPVDCATPGPEVIKLFSNSTQLSMKFILPINVKMPAVVGVLTFINTINTAYFSCYEQLNLRTQLS